MSSNARPDGESADLNELEAFLGAFPDTRTVEVMTVDLGGILRGKRVPREELPALFSQGLSASGSIPLVNTLGEVPESIGYGSRDGDPDKTIRPVPASVAAIPWLDSATGQTLASYWELDGSPCLHDPRQILRRVTDKLGALGLHPVIALELEFYLLDADTGPVPRPRLPVVPGTGLSQEGMQYGMLEDLWDADSFLDKVHDAAVIQGIPVTTALSEYSPGQFEINLHHVDDPLLACDHAVLLKRLVKGVARQLGLGASFMAKPFAESAGCGQHVHLSLYDDRGENAFSDTENSNKPPISLILEHGVGGLVATMAESMAIFAPNANSYRRLVAGEYAPLNENWGYNHRNVAIRLPVSDPHNMRLEHRVASADANPYLVVAAILAGLHHGISNRLNPPPIIQVGESLDGLEPTLPRRWHDALNCFEAGRILPSYLGEEYSQLYAAVRRDECENFQAQVTNRDYEWYLRAV